MLVKIEHLFSDCIRLLLFILYCCIYYKTDGALRIESCRPSDHQANWIVPQIYIIT